MALPITGAPGTVKVVIAFDGTEFALGPTPLTALTTNEYVVPGSSPVTTWLVAELVKITVVTVVPVRTSICDAVIGDPPSLAGAAQLTVAEPIPAVAATPVGALGTVATGVTALEGAESGPAPNAFTARTWRV